MEVDVEICLVRIVGFVWIVSRENGLVGVCWWVEWRRCALDVNIGVKFFVWEQMNLRGVTGSFWDEQTSRIERWRTRG